MQATSSFCRTVRSLQDNVAGLAIPSKWQQRHSIMGTTQNSLEWYCSCWEQCATCSVPQPQPKWNVSRKLGLRLLKTWVQRRAIHSVRPWVSHVTFVSLLSPATGLASACHSSDSNCYVSCELAAGCMETASILHTPSLSPPVHQPPHFAQLTSYTHSNILGASLVAQMLKNLPAMWKTWVRSLDQEGLLEKGMATHSSILAWRIPWTEEPDGLWSMGSLRVRHDWLTNTN